ncbi:hypothetical protein M2352_002576 [Azospirillum fermentarium]|uniref:hypothetical protein n=1 Tax=Azospirillum fermentarium TaxID=1233114 RepID=UPI002225D730|nr:hypothetical protein [Azospirillum fermentarium]MCW2246985.1 hypothetical protein [Azospirillum fermentarium]
MRSDILKILLTAASLFPAPAWAGSQVEISGFARSSIPAMDAQGNSTTLSSDDMKFPLLADEEHEKYWVMVKGQRLSLQRRHIILPKPSCAFSISGGNSISAGNAGAGPSGCPVDMGKPK